MISTVPPPRPVSVNSPILPLSSPVLYHKSTSIPTKEAYQNDEEVAKSTYSLTVSLDRLPRRDIEMEDADDSITFPSHASQSAIQFNDLPFEIHEAILDHLFGERTSGSVSSIPGRPDTRSWIRALRHPRRKTLSNLALISPIWRDLVQERIYRHIKVKGTKDGLAECENWFRSHPHLVRHVRHTEYWIPVWGNRAHKTVAPHLREVPPIRRYLNEEAGLFGHNNGLVQQQLVMPDWDLSDNRNRSPNDFAFHVASHNASLEEIFRHVKDFFPETRILTLEAGHCKKPPLIKHFANDPSGLTGNYHLEQLPNIRTLFMRGAWNIMRDYKHWATISEALPSLREWHCAYAKPKLEAYQTICRALSSLSSSLIHLDISLEGFHSKDHSHLLGGKIGRHHMCRILGRLAPQLEHLSLTGYMCADLFDTARAATADRPQDARLRSVDLVVKTCCKDEDDANGLLSPLLDEPPGITNMKFIDSFETLVLSSIRCLDTFLDLSYIRIRFIDLDAQCAVLNPYFHLADNKCMGLWSHEIVETLAQVRSTAHFVELADGIFTQYGPNNVIIGAVYPRSRPLSININTYKILSDAAKS
ncbi:conserved hypothetical protein [Talaromyces stipitatus ATCC 10500]|uniref:Uncharacterized protein n=1 Tax=Talaromyces stipitatus (strain ATCC 10500 / CBS 375.48 / QM 6759 / NRRL 1006) TaxID=441959 RepID=B8M4D0_TALSN|nr:uncharacterized protein TSTA_024490 [Talaromyces stipitatus ATCC 10500]EED19125.1 conserved hypothetical protein [Talaromyces stipitatus ATCC 10500]